MQHILRFDKMSQAQTSKLGSTSLNELMETKRQLWKRTFVTTITTLSSLVRYGGQGYLLSYSSHEEAHTHKLILSATACFSVLRHILTTNKPLDTPEAEGDHPHG